VTPHAARAQAAHEAFEERAGILEFEAGVPRREAERLALLMLDGMPIPHHVADAIAHGLLPRGWRPQ
jgi:hypothetical protein